MRRLALPLGLVLGFVVAGSVSGANTTAFTGEWIGNDPAFPNGDARLYVKGGTHANLKVSGQFGSDCTDTGAITDFVLMKLTGEVDQDTLTATIRMARCGSVQLHALHGQTMLLFLDRGPTDDPADDTLEDPNRGVTWHRV